MSHTCYLPLPLTYPKSCFVPKGYSISNYEGVNSGYTYFGVKSIPNLLEYSSSQAKLNLTADYPTAAFSLVYTLFDRMIRDKDW